MLLEKYAKQAQRKSVFSRLRNGEQGEFSKSVSLHRQPREQGVTQRHPGWHTHESMQASGHQGKRAWEAHQLRRYGGKGSHMLDDSMIGPRGTTRGGRRGVRMDFKAVMHAMQTRSRWS
jgi:hypothetical protein